MTVFRQLSRWVIGAIVVVSVIIVCGFIGKGALGLSSDEASIFSIPASIVAIYLYRRTTKPTAESNPAVDVVSRVLIIVVLLATFALGTRSRSLESTAWDLDSEISSVRSDLEDTQSNIEDLEARVDSIESFGLGR
jgi:hypothetical protein